MEKIDNNSNPESKAALLNAELAIVGSASPDPVDVGNILTYTLVITNNGPLPADNVLLVETLPTGMISPEYSIDGGITWLPWLGSVNLLLLLPGLSITVLLRGTVSSSCTSSITNTASVTSLDPLITDPDLSNNSATVTTAVNPSSCNSNCNNSSCTCNNSCLKES
ncbi:hypothetical protein HMPREF1092_02915 [Clostridium thermobutyricum]|uniref:DUF11 domain-containing protein n=1 Tax=Clostridium thermobutyricum TaxID=29372 RepID=N9WA74_9CLOT|nr:DUF11 domain-containing protein [Clostridium thermobutyricum]ENY99779.1 hypothetical protein HMPREF1092_02915 [Clostridium thermobutyricum]